MFTSHLPGRVPLQEGGILMQAELAVKMIVLIVAISVVYQEYATIAS
jgi:hypothetical protein